MRVDKLAIDNQIVVVVNTP